MNLNIGNIKIYILKGVYNIWYLYNPTVYIQGPRSRSSLSSSVQKNY